MDLKKYIIENYYTKTYQELADELGVKLNTIEECIKKMMDLGMLESKTKRWTKKEEKFIIENLANYTTEEFAKIYKVQIEQMRKKIYYLKKRGKKKRIKKIDIDLEVDKGYQRLIAEPQDKGLNNSKFDLILTVGQAYKIAKKGLREGQIRVNETFIGKLIQETEECIFFQGKDYTDSYQKKDYLLGEIEIREV